jgi:hypothetical protein
MPATRFPAEAGFQMFPDCTGFQGRDIVEGDERSAAKVRVSAHGAAGCYRIAVVSPI